MVRYEEINNEWRKEIATFADSHSVIYKWRGAEMFGAIQSFYIYTKAFDIVEKALKQIPDNFVINLSEWHGNLDNASESLLEKCNIFAYDDKGSSEKVKAMYHCPAVDAKGHETGITCAQCRRCVRKGNTTAVYSH